MKFINDSAPPAPLAFRDPGGTVFHRNGRILRMVYPAAAIDLEAFLRTGAAREAMDSEKLIRSVRIASTEFPDLGAAFLVEHEPVPFPSFPYEWAPEML